MLPRSRACVHAAAARSHCPCGGEAAKTYYIPPPRYALRGATNAPSHIGLRSTLARDHDDDEALEAVEDAVRARCDLTQVDLRDNGVRGDVARRLTGLGVSL